MRTWHVITGEFPPQPGGVSDYTERVVRALASPEREVHVWAPAGDEPAGDDERAPSLWVHRVPDAFSPRGLFALERGLRRGRGARRLLVQYVPHAYGYRAMNLPFATWLSTRPRRERLWLMFHEVAFPFFEGPLRTNVIAAATHLMAGLLARRADQILVSTPDWGRRLRRLSPRRLDVTWAPIPSNLPTHVSEEEVAAARALLTGGGRHACVLGHFGTYGAHVAPMLDELAPRLLEGRAERTLALFGRGADAFARRLVATHPALADRVQGAPALAAPELAARLAACDALVQPFPDGVTTRRTSLMAGLALGVPIVTNRGRLTEAEWATLAVVALAEHPADIPRLVELLLGDPDRRGTLAANARGIYDERFSLERTVETLTRLERVEDAIT